MSTRHVWEGPELSSIAQCGCLKVSHVIFLSLQLSSFSGSLQFVSSCINSLGILWSFVHTNLHQVSVRLLLLDFESGVCSLGFCICGISYFSGLVTIIYSYIRLVFNLVLIVYVLANSLALGIGLRSPNIMGVLCLDKWYLCYSIGRIFINGFWWLFYDHLWGCSQVGIVVWCVSSILVEHMSEYLHKEVDKLKNTMYSHDMQYHKEYNQTFEVWNISSQGSFLCDHHERYSFICLLPKLGTQITCRIKKLDTMPLVPSSVSLTKLKAIEYFLWLFEVVDATMIAFYCVEVLRIRSYWRVLRSVPNLVSVVSPAHPKFVCQVIPLFLGSCWCRTDSILRCWELLLTAQEGIEFLKLYCLNLHHFSPPLF